MGQKPPSAALAACVIFLCLFPRVLSSSFIWGLACRCL